MTAGSTQKLTATTSEEAKQGVHNMFLITSLSSSLGNSPYPSIRSTFAFTVNPSTCNCALLTWDIPSKLTMNTGLMKTPTQKLPIATVNEASKTAYPAIRSCTGAYACDMTSTISIL